MHVAFWILPNLLLFFWFLIYSRKRYSGTGVGFYNVDLGCRSQRGQHDTPVPNTDRGVIWGNVSLRDRHLRSIL